MKQAFTIPGRLPAMSDFLSAHKSGLDRYEDLEPVAIYVVSREIHRAALSPHKGNVWLNCTFYESPVSGVMRDKADISSFAVMAIEAALQGQGIIEHNDWQCLKGYGCSFFRVADNPRIEVEIEDA